MKFLTIELHENSKLARHLPNICELIQEAGIQFSYCVNLIRCCDNDPIVVEYISNAMKTPSYTVNDPRALSNDEKGWWVISNHYTIKAVTLMLKYCMPNALEINLPRVTKLPLTFEDLINKLAEISFSGVLVLDLWNSYETFSPCDDVIAPLIETE